MLGAGGITLPEGTPSDSPEQQTVHGLAHRKEDVYVGLLAMVAYRLSRPASRCCIVSETTASPSPW